jgi:hypothetical protein
MGNLVSNWHALQYGTRFLSMFEYRNQWEFTYQKLGLHEQDGVIFECANTFMEFAIARTCTTQERVL